MVAQPQADEVAAVLGLGVVGEFGAGVTEDAVVDELQLARFEVEIGGERVVVEEVEERRHRVRTLFVELLALQGIAAADLVGAEAGPQFLVRGEGRRGEYRRLARMEFALAVEPERAVEPRQALRMTRASIAL